MTENILLLDIHAVKTSGPDNAQEIEKASLRLVTKRGLVFTTAWMDSDAANKHLESAVEDIRGGEIEVIK